MENNQEKNKDLIKVDINFISNPMFSTNKKRSKGKATHYIFNNDKNTFLEICPKGEELSNKGVNLIPGELEEKLFIGILRLMRKKGNDHTIITTLVELKKEINYISNSHYLLKDSLYKLASANYKFKNTLYHTNKNEIIKNKIDTTIFSLKEINVDKKYSNNNNIGPRIKTAYEITLKDSFYRNIKENSYLVYDSKILLKIENPITRRIYFLLEKLRGNKYELNIGAKELFERIPLKYKSPSIDKKVKVLEKALEELKKHKIIAEFFLIKKKFWIEATFKIMFKKNTNQYNHYDDKECLNLLKSQGLKASNIIEKIVDKENIKKIEASFLKAMLLEIMKDFNTHISKVKEKKRLKYIEQFILATPVIKIDEDNSLIIIIEKDFNSNLTAFNFEFAKNKTITFTDRIRSYFENNDKYRNKSDIYTSSIYNSDNYKNKLRLSYNEIIKEKDLFIDNVFKNYKNQDTLDMIGPIIKKSISEAKLSNSYSLDYFYNNNIDISVIDFIDNKSIFYNDLEIEYIDDEDRVNIFLSDRLKSELARTLQ